MEQQKKVCINCHYVSPAYFGDRMCLHGKAAIVDLVTGINQSKSCYTMRGEGQPCGPEGKLYQE